MSSFVAPPAGAWIETLMAQMKHTQTNVAPPAGAWIETASLVKTRLLIESRPLRARGLKHMQQVNEKGEAIGVAPPAGAWIETGLSGEAYRVIAAVAPPAGAWIETYIVILIGL